MTGVDAARGYNLGGDGCWALELPARPSSAEGRELVVLAVDVT